MTQQASTQKSMGYDHPAYTARQGVFLSRAAGANGVTAKYAAHAALLAYALNVATLVAGTSTYTYTNGAGVATVAVASDQLSLIVVTNTASAGATVALSTSTYGPYAVTGSFIGAGGTNTNQVGAFSQIQLNAQAGTGGLGGVVIPAGSTFFIQAGTDATAAEGVTLDYNIQPLAGVAA
jgi:hypothetical protein